MFGKLLEKKVDKINVAESVTTPSSETVIIGSAAQYLEQESSKPWFFSLTRVDALTVTDTIEKLRKVTIDGQKSGLCLIYNRGKDVRISYSPKVSDGIYGSASGKTQTITDFSVTFGEVVNNNPKVPTLVTLSTIKKDGEAGPTVQSDAQINKTNVAGMDTEVKPIPVPDRLNPNFIGPVLPLIKTDIDKNGKQTPTTYTSKSPVGQNIQIGTALTDNTTLKLKAKGNKMIGPIGVFFK